MCSGSIRVAMSWALWMWAWMSCGIQCLSACVLVEMKTTPPNPYFVEWLCRMGMSARSSNSASESAMWCGYALWLSRLNQCPSLSPRRAHVCEPL